MEEHPCAKPADFAIATRNPMKIRSLRVAAGKLCNVKRILSVESPPGLPSQPVGWRQVVLGALRRAIVAYESLGEGFGVGVEAGPVMIGSLVLETQVAVVLGPGRLASVGTSQSFMLPRHVQDMVVRGVELSKAVGVQRPGDIGEGIGYIGILTRGAITRQDLTIAAILMALLPWANGYWSNLPTPAQLEEAILRPGNV